MTSISGEAKAEGSVLAGALTIEPAGESSFGGSLGAASRIVLVHGSMDRQAGFMRLAKILGRRHSVVLYDRRGYASSAGLSGPYDISQHVIDLLEVIGEEPSFVVGHSFGGTVALACAQRHPHLVRGVATYENPMSWLAHWPLDTGAGRAARRQGDPEAAAEEFLIRFIGQRVWDRLPEGTKRARRAEGRALVGELGSIYGTPPFDVSEQLLCPLVVGVGSHARDFMLEGARLLAERNDSRLVVLEGAHHNAHASRAEEFAERIVDPLIERVGSGRWPSNEDFP